MKVSPFLLLLSSILDRQASARGAAPQISPGHYATTINGLPSQAICEPGHYCSSGVRHPCPPGRYGSGFGLTTVSCTGPCDSGHYCPLGSISARALPCGSPAFYCPPASASPFSVSPGHYSLGGDDGATRTAEAAAPPGRYARGGVLADCLAGRFGDRPALTAANCTGPCAPGFYCPPASVAATQVPCGGEAVFCPAGSALPSPVRKGHYTSTSEEGCRPGTYRNAAEAFDPTVRPVAASAIGTSVVAAECRPCPRGTYKVAQGDGRELCRPCPSRTSTSTSDGIGCECFRVATGERFEFLQFDAAAGRCESVAEGKAIAPDGVLFNNTQLARFEEIPCPKGYYCNEGVRRPCPPGHFGNKDLETNPLCSGECAAGYWCGEGSTREDQNPCGGADTYCPAGSSSPTYVSTGYYTNEDAPPEVRHVELLCPPGHWCSRGVRRPCPAGRYGASHALATAACNGLCFAGFHCPPASTGPQERKCGNVTVHCPRGSGEPVATRPGHYSHHGNVDLDFRDAIDPQNETMVGERICERGYHCRDGSRFLCPGGTYGWSEGARDVADCPPCRAGYFCPRDPAVPNVVSDPFPCGDADVFCPKGSEAPRDVRLGHYSIGRDPTDLERQVAEKLCEPGHFCEQGVRHRCPARTFGDKAGLYWPQCSDLCPAGFECPEGTEQPVPCDGMTYSTGSAERCTVCLGEVFESAPQTAKLLCHDARLCCDTLML